MYNMQYMRVFPAVDIQNGRAVRLFEGDPDLETVYFVDPVGAVLYWQDQGAEWLHLVDLDAATGRGDNRAVLKQIAAAAEIPFEVGGGVRSLSSAWELIELGAARVVVGTVAVKQPEILDAMLEALGAEKTVVSMDAKGAEVMVSGWAQGSGETVTRTAERLWSQGVTDLIYTDVSRDGTLIGLDLDMMAQVRQIWPGKLVVGGGIATNDDLRALQVLEVEGAIVGKALYEGKISLKQWIQPAT